MAGPRLLTRQMYSEKSSPAVFCQLHVRYWMAAPSSAASCLSRMAELLWSLSESPSEMLLRTGPMRGPMATSCPPNHDDQPVCDSSSADVSGAGASRKWPFSSDGARASSGSAGC